jgi:hypothetical protein
MTEFAGETRNAKKWWKFFLTATLAASALVAFGIRVRLALSLEDTDALESPLVLSIARQLTKGPWEMYGPYGGQNPLVLIHAPLYYRLAALGAWPLVKAGLEPATAALVSGRALSIIGFVAIAWVVFRLTRLDGALPQSACWAVCLFATAPVIGGLPVAVRPDALGVAFQSLGVLLVLSILRSPPTGRARYLGAYAAFGIALCIKQHFLMAPILSTGLLLGAWRGGRLPFRLISQGVLLFSAIVVSVYGGEELATTGRMSQAVFEATWTAASVHPANWRRVQIVMIAVMAWSFALLAAVTGAGLSAVAARDGLGRRLIVFVGTGLLAVIVMLAASRLAGVERWDTVMMVLTTSAALAALVVVCGLSAPKLVWNGRFDLILWIYWAGEIALMSALCRASTGAWTNYALQSIVFASVLSARLISRAVKSSPSIWSLIPITIAALLVPITVAFDVSDTFEIRRDKRLRRDRVVELVGRPPDEFFFVDLPGDNRVQGCRDLVYDDWLYPVFESMRRAEPRSRWLRNALISSRIHVIVTTSAGPRIAGIEETLPKLGYAPLLYVEPYYVWSRAGTTIRRVRAKAESRKHADAGLSNDRSP